MDRMRVGNYALDTDLMMTWVEKIGIALIILVITWALAKLAKWAFVKLVDNVHFLQHRNSSGTTLGQSLGRIVSLFIWLFGLLAILQVFNLGGVLAPVQRFLNNIVDFIPNLIGAALLLFIGIVIARIVRDLIVTALQTFDFDRWMSRSGAEVATGNPRLSRTIGTIAYALIVIFFAILALDVLDLEAVSGPASNMLESVLAAIPNIIAAAIILGIGYLISRFVVQILKEVLPGLGVDQAVASADFLPAGTRISSIIARVAQIAIMLFAAIAATRVLGFPELTLILDDILELGARVIFGAIVIGVGFLIANMLARLVGEASENGLAAAIVKYAAIILFTFMGLEYMGVGDDIVQTAFTALVVGAAVAGALAFGWGGRHVAGKVLEDLRDNPPQPDLPPARTGTAATTTTTTAKPVVKKTTAKPATKPVTKKPPLE